jgi:hypothetical protein
LIGYDFGPVDMQVWVTDAVVGNNAPQGPGGISVWSHRLQDLGTGRSAGAGYKELSLLPLLAASV